VQLPGSDCEEHDDQHHVHGSSSGGKLHSGEGQDSTDAYTSVVAASLVPREEGLLAYWHDIWRRKWIVLLAVAVAMVSIFIIDQVRPREYSATSSVLLLSQSFTGTTPNELTPQDIATLIRLVQSDPVTTIVSKRLGQSAPDASVFEVGTTATANITVTSKDAKLAARAANTYAVAFIAYSRNQYLAQQTQVSKAVQRQIDALQRQIDVIQARLPNSSPSVAGILTGELGTLSAEQLALRTQLIQIQSDVATAPSAAVLIQPASVPTSPSSPRPLTDLFIAALLGLLIGIGIAMLQTLRDSRIRSLEDLREVAGGLGVVGVIPRVSDWAGVEVSLIAGVGRQRSAIGEAFRSLRTSTQFLNQDLTARIVQITSPLVDEGKTTVSANLAVSLAEAGQSVILIDCDLHRPRVHWLFNVPNAVGITSVLTGAETLEDACARDSRVPNLTLLPAGPVPANPSELLGSSRNRSLLAQLGQDYDYVIIDSSPLLPVTDAVVLATIATGVLFVCAATKTTKDDFEQALNMLRGVKATMLGVVFNMAAESDCVNLTRYYEHYVGTVANGSTPSPSGTSHGRTPRATVFQRSYAGPSPVPTRPSSQPNGEEPTTAGPSLQ
jgi:polysaccharide biosynthesis transport protein